MHGCRCRRAAACRRTRRRGPRCRTGRITAIPGIADECPCAGQALCVPLLPGGRRSSYRPRRQVRSLSLHLMCGGMDGHEIPGANHELVRRSFGTRQEHPPSFVAACPSAFRLKAEATASKRKPQHRTSPRLKPRLWRSTEALRAKADGGSEVDELVASAFRRKDKRARFVVKEWRPG